MTKTQTRCLLALWAALLSLCLCACSASFPRLEVAGYRITEEEYLRAMYQARNEVLSDHAAAGISLKNWHEPTALGDPCRLTADRAVEILTEYYAVSTLAVERGYLAEAGYGAMLKDMEEVNRQRQEAIQSGAVVTGLPRFTVDDYLTYRASSLRLQFCNDPDNPDAQVTEAEILARYEADRDDLYRRPDDLELAYVVIDAAPEEADARYAELQALRELAAETGDLAQALDQMPHLKPCFEEISVDQSSYSVYARSHTDILACAQGLQSGDISQVFREDGWLCLVECRERRTHSYAPLEDVASVVAQSIRESRYDALIAQRMAQTELSGDLQKLYRFTEAQFP